MNDLLRPRIWPSFLASSGVPSTGSGQAPLRRTVKVRLGTNTAVPRDELPGTRRKRLRCAWHAHLRGLATAIHEISWLTHWFTEIARFAWEPCGD